jgi:hypothetical protein
VEDIQLAQDKALVSLDVDALYPILPILKALKQFDT